MWLTAWICLQWRWKLARIINIWQNWSKRDQYIVGDNTHHEWCSHHSIDYRSAAMRIRLCQGLGNTGVSAKNVSHQVTLCGILRPKSKVPAAKGRRWAPRVPSLVRDTHDLQPIATNYSGHRSRATLQTEFKAIGVRDSWFLCHSIPTLSTFRSTNSAKRFRTEK